MTGSLEHKAEELSERARWRGAGLETAQSSAYPESACSSGHVQCGVHPVPVCTRSILCMGMLVAHSPV